MSLVKEFQEFIARGNAIDMAVGVVLGTAFGKIVTSLVSDILMPPVGLVLAKVQFKDLQWILFPKQVATNGDIITEGVTIHYGLFIQTIIDFFLIGLCVFLVVKVIQNLKRKPPEPHKEAPIPPPEDIQLLGEIRDLLKQSPQTNSGRDKQTV